MTEKLKKQIIAEVSEVLGERPTFHGSLRLNFKDGNFVNTNIEYTTKPKPISTKNLLNNK